MTVLDERWYAHPDDLIGGWCVLNRDHPPTRLNRNADPDAREVGNLLGEEVARHVVELHNAGLPDEAVSTPWPDQPEVPADIAVAALEARRNDTGKPIPLDRFPEGLTRIDSPSAPGATS